MLTTETYNRTLELLYQDALSCEQDRDTEGVLLKLRQVMDLMQEEHPAFNLEGWGDIPRLLRIAERTQTLRNKGWFPCSGVVETMLIWIVWAPDGGADTEAVLASAEAELDAYEAFSPNSVEF